MIIKHAKGNLPPHSRALALLGRNPLYDALARCTSFVPPQEKHRLADE